MERLASSLSLSITSETEERCVCLGSDERAANFYQKVTDIVRYCRLAVRNFFFKEIGNYVRTRNNSLRLQNPNCPPGCLKFDQQQLDDR